MTDLNDHHSRLNRTKVHSVLSPSNLVELQQVIEKAIESRNQIAICAGKGAMGGQQFLTHQTCVDVSDLNKVLSLDAEQGLIKVEAGIHWDALIKQLRELQNVSSPTNDEFWTIRQKQTGANELSIGGSVSANAHGRGLNMAPLVDDIESLEVITATGEMLSCSRQLNNRLFSLVIGGYGCFGIIYSVTLRLAPFQWLRRKVDLIKTENVISHLENAISQGAQFGDFQFTIDSQHEDFLRRGIASVYYPTDQATSETASNTELDKAQLTQLLLLAHTSPAEAFQRYQDHYLKTDQLIYASDYHQLAAYPKHYHQEIDQHLGCKGSEMITELFVPRHRLTEFMESCRTLLRKQKAQVIYGTVRLIKKDEQSFLPWAKNDYACVIFNLHVDHCPDKLEAVKQQFRSLIDAALAHQGCYYLTYHRWATPSQIVKAYPNLYKWIDLKQHFDPHSLFASNWFKVMKKDVKSCQNTRNHC